MKYTLYIILIGLAQPLLAQSPYIEAVDEYVPAPGQFVNVLPLYEDGDDAQSMANKCTEAIAHNAGGLITLGAWGGYVTFHFDHPVVNVLGEKDLLINGNAIVGSSEAGIVMVSRDENQNGLPDDTWYELNGSAESEGLSPIYGYELVYTKDGELQDIPWTDNQGNTGWVLRNNFHTQEYFPLWIDSPLNLIGTRLPDNAEELSGNGTYWSMKNFAWGYVDNLPNADTEGNSFDLSWAVDPITRQAVHLPQIDFVRVYTALNQSAGWLGETSTEIAGAMDLHPTAVASLHPLKQSSPTHRFDLWGRPIKENDRPRILQIIL